MKNLRGIVREELSQIISEGPRQKRTEIEQLRIDVDRYVYKFEEAANRLSAIGGIIYKDISCDEKLARINDIIDGPAPKTKPVDFNNTLPR